MAIIEGPVIIKEFEVIQNTSPTGNFLLKFTDAAEIIYAAPLSKGQVLHLAKRLIAVTESPPVIGD